MRSPLCVRASEKNVQIGKRKDGRLAKCCTFDAIVTSEQHDAFLLHLRRKLASPFCSLLSLVRVGKMDTSWMGIIEHREGRGYHISPGGRCGAGRRARIRVFFCGLLLCVMCIFKSRRRGGVEARRGSSAVFCVLLTCAYFIFRLDVLSK